jgi:hypothetical protein
MSNDTLALAKREYSKAGSEVRSSLERIFGADALKRDWRDVKTFEDACAFNGNGTALPFDNPTSAEQEWLNALYMMNEIHRAINQGFHADWGNEKQYKWRPWFRYDPSSSGFRFGASNCDAVASASTGGSRLCCESSEKAEYIGKQFIDIWNIILLK